MADVKQQTVKVEALEPHTAFGESYDVGDEYDIPAEHADSVVLQGKAKRVEGAGPAKRAATKPAKKAKKGRK